MTKKMQSLLKRARFEKKYFVILVTLFAVIGVYTLLNSSAATIRDASSLVTTSEGTLEVLHGHDFKNNTSVFDYLLKTSDNKTLKLSFPDRGPELLSGSKVSVRGVIADDKLLVEKADDLTVTTPAKPHNSPRKTAVILFNFKNSVSQPITKTAAQEVIFKDANSADEYFQETSYGDRSLIGKNSADGSADVFGWYTINIDVPTTASACEAADITAFGSAARTAATNAGVDLTGYDHVVHVFPGSTATGCTWGGYGYINGAYSWLKANTPSGSSKGLSPYIASHELGHNFGAWHANGYDCQDTSANPVPISTNCTNLEYEDPFDVMGKAGFYRHVNNFHRGQLLWLTSSSNTQTVTTSGTYTLYSPEQASSSVVAIKIAKGNLTQFGSVKYFYYYLEYRRPFGAFDNFASTDPAVNGVSIRLATAYTSTSSSWLIDNVPSTTTFNDAPLAVGKTFYDPDLKLSIKTNSVSAASASVQVTFNANPPPPPPSNQPPQVNITSPANGATFTAPATVSISASASDADGTVSKVEFFQGSTKLGEDSTSPYSFSWSNVAAGTYNLTAKATDNSGNTTISGAISITVQSAPSPTLSVSLSSTPSSGVEFGLFCQPILTKNHKF